MQLVPRLVFLILGSAVFLCLLYTTGRNSHLREVMQETNPWKISMSFSIGELAFYALLSALATAPAFIVASRTWASWALLGLSLLSASPLAWQVLDWSRCTNWSHSAEDYLFFSTLLSLIGFDVAIIAAIYFRRRAIRAL